MDPISFLDSIILFVTKKIAKGIYFAFGVNNFDFARYLMVFSFAVSSTLLLFDKSILSFWIALCLLNIVIYLVTVYLRGKTKEKFMNPARRYPYCYVRVSFVIKIFILTSILILILFNERAPMQDKIFITSGCLSFIASLCAVLFASVEPEDPIDSLLKKGLKWLKGLFETEALPQPA